MTFRNFITEANNLTKPYSTRMHKVFFEEYVKQISRLSQDWNYVKSSQTFDKLIQDEAQVMFIVELKSRDTGTVKELVLKDSTYKKLEAMTKKYWSLKTSKIFGFENVLIDVNTDKIVVSMTVFNKVIRDIEGMEG